MRAPKRFDRAARRTTPRRRPPHLACAPRASSAYRLAAFSFRATRSWHPRAQRHKDAAPHMAAAADPARLEVDRLGGRQRGDQHLVADDFFVFNAQCTALAESNLSIRRDVECIKLPTRGGQE